MAADASRGKRKHIQRNARKIISVIIIISVTPQNTGPQATACLACPIATPLGIWLYNAGIRQGSSDFFSFSDDYNFFALRDLKTSPLNGPSQRIETSLCSADSPLLSSPQCLQQLDQNVNWPFSRSRLHSNSESLALSKRFRRCWASCSGSILGPSSSLLVPKAS